MSKITVEKAVLEQALAALNHGITEMNHRGCAIECMSLHHATKAIREELAQPQPVQQCKWPTCQSEKYQQDLEDQIMRELVGEQPVQEPVATVIKKGSERQWMSERLGRFPDGIYSLYTSPQAQPEQQEPVRSERHSYVPVDSNMRDGNGNHPNDKEPRTAECIQALTARGDSEGQGLDGFWKWGFAAGFNAALAAAPQPCIGGHDKACARVRWGMHSAPQPQPVQGETK